MEPIIESQSERSRRDFLLSAGVFAAAGAMLAGSASAQQAETAPSAKPFEPQDSTTRADGAIDVAMIAAAEVLAGISYTASERQMLSQTLGDQLSMLASRQQLGSLPNDLGPSLRFDPRLPGMKFNGGTTRSRWSKISAGTLPDSEEDIAFAPLSHLSQWIRTRKLSSARLTDIYLNRLEELDPQLKCVITLCEDHARRQAADADAEIARGKYRGPLHGVPWGAKDLLDTAGIRTTWGAEPFVDRVPTTDATVVHRLNEAGAVLIAKLSLGALAYNDIWFGGRTNNPWNMRQGSSGSSAGSAAATAAGLVGFSIGTETYGSITSPCMRCGTTGLRPTFGRVSRAGAMALCWSLDKIGPICRTVEDCAMVLAAINGGDVSDPHSIDMPYTFDASMPLNAIRVGFDAEWFRNASELEKGALEATKRLGVQIVEIRLPDWPYESMLTMLYCEAASAFEDLTRSNLDDSLRWQQPQAWPNTFRQTWFIPGIEYVQADRFRRQVMRMMAERFADVHVIIGPSFAGDLCLISNNTGHPSLTLRCGVSTSPVRTGSGNQTQGERSGPNAMRRAQPTGITLIGRLYDEGTLCRLGVALEHELDVWQRRPNMT